MSLIRDHIAVIGPAPEAALRAFADQPEGTMTTCAFPDLATFLAAVESGAFVAHCAIATGLTSWDESRHLRSEIHACDAISDLPVILHIDSTVLPDLEGWDQHTTITWHQMEPIVMRSIVLAATNQYRRMLTLRHEADERTSAIGLLVEGQFVFQTPSQAHRLAELLAQSGPDPGRVSVGLLELFMNAIEHGNLGLGYARKTQLIESGEYDTALNEMLGEADYSGKFVRVQVNHLDDAIEYDIEDEGEGFDAEPFLTFDPERAMASHGRGIAMARLLFFDDVAYIGDGSRVIARKSCLKARSPRPTARFADRPRTSKPHQAPERP